MAAFVPPYSAFADRSENGLPQYPTIDISIMSATDFTSPAEKEQKIFDCGEGWSLFKDGRYYRFVLPLPSPHKPLWVAWATHDFSSITVHPGRDPVYFTYPLDQVLLMHILALHEGAIVHSAGVKWGGACYVFLGVSGAGKSTLSRLLADVEGIDVLSDDRMIIRRINGHYRAFGTPWPGDAGFAVNDSAPLGGIFFLNKAATTTIEPITPAEAVKRLLPVTSVPWYEKEMVSNMLSFFDGLLQHVPAYNLHFAPDEGAAATLLPYLH